MGDHFNEGFLQENARSFCQAVKQSGCNNEVMLLLHEVAVKWVSTVPQDATF